MDLEKYRQPWESDEHWVFRKEFIQTHRERFPNEDRLLCLAQVFANVELLGCSYPEPVMAQINELSREIPQVQKLRDKRSERTVVKFVKDTSEGASRYSGKRSALSDNREAKKTTAQQNSKDYPSLGSFNRIGAADLFDSKPLGDPIASYYTVKGASQSQGENPLSQSLISYNTVKLNSASKNIGNLCKEGERGSPSTLLSHKPMIIDCGLKQDEKNTLTKVDDNTSKIDKVRHKLSAYMARGSNNVSNGLQRACLNSKVKIDSPIGSNSKICEKGCKFHDGFHCTICICGVFIGFGIERNKKLAHRMAMKNSVNQLLEFDRKFVTMENWSTLPSQKLKLVTPHKIYGTIDICQCFLKQLESEDTIKTKEVPRKEIQKTKPMPRKLPPNITKTFLSSLESKFREISVAKLALEMNSKENNELHFLDVLCAKCGIKREYKFQDIHKTNKKFKFIASLKIANVLCGKAAGGSKKEAQLTACRSALSLLTLNEFRIVSIEEGKEDLKLIASDDPNFSSKKCLEPFDPNIFTPVVHIENKALPTTKSKVTNQRNFKGPTSKPKQMLKPVNFERDLQYSLTPQVQQTVLVDDTLVNPGSNDISMLMNSCNSSRTAITFNFEDVKINDLSMKRCSVIINGQTEGIGDGETKQLSKSTACKVAIKNLQQRIYTIQIKQIVSSSAPQINKYQVPGKGMGHAVIDSSNKGFQMMQMMGWKGKGIGKGEKGIETPVSVQDVYQRQGLGFSNDEAKLSHQFKKMIQDIISEFAKSDFSNDLKFSPDFSKQERKYIHTVAEKHKLKAVSKGGQGSGRYLVLSHKLNPQQLLHNLLNSGGSNEKYTLIPPGQGSELN